MTRIIDYVGLTDDNLNVLVKYLGVVTDLRRSGVLTLDLYQVMSQVRNSSQWMRYYGSMNPAIYETWLVRHIQDELGDYMTLQQKFLAENPDFSPTLAPGSGFARRILTTQGEKYQQHARDCDTVFLARLEKLVNLDLHTRTRPKNPVFYNPTVVLNTTPVPTNYTTASWPFVESNTGYQVIR